ncbi:lactaldehyde dehydrogenase / glycolaldehyde dehydrogenase [Paracoccus aminovorans]|uniref:Lactaldehyde dehydrogenase / glycolaldehyde dehydrogenase n=1 Tax=Paracoccus aminovorans TaxID=34004 RepID=A0A1I3DGM8_9RHOB|nr:aldehyde dehydrogenase [Paracoccus aminovorans]CQR84073.1 aldehyde dehydrogenase [Paracoccus aminovorans]SFH85806.1 lactaldehyde dehydrogenase / glycolaldehyde dehydrogenase [Paracoccus aminovorans]
MTVLHQSFVDGRFVDSRPGDEIPVFNPATDELLSRIPDDGPDRVAEAVAAARKAQKGWEARPAIERAGYLRKLAQGIRANADGIARAIVAEQGKIQPLAQVEVAFTADYLDYMAEWARRLEGEIIASDRPGETILLFRQAIGVVGGILPWNFPFFLIARKLAPALLTGNTIVIKPSEETPNNAAMFAEVLAQADLPAGVANIVYGRGATTGAALCDDPDVGLISFTGSVATGSRIMAAAARNITKVNLELGGKAPAIVCADADLDLAARAITDSRVINSGQVCNCAERVYVERAVADEFTARLTAAMSARRFGDPGAQPDVDYGPLINRAALEKVAGMVDRARAAGAELVTGGAAADLGRGSFYVPTVLTGCAQDSEIMQKEVFGPVIPVNVVDDLDQAIGRANDSEYGLTSSIYTRDISNAMRACRELKFGETYINRENFEAMQGYHAGARKSGIGGADGKHGLYDYTQSHVVYLQG